MDWAAARKHMVDGQLRPNRITDPRLLAAWGDLPRERFLPPESRSLAYADRAVPLPGGRAALNPMVLARMIQVAAVRPDDRALVLCAGPGYGAAVLARLGARVVAVEPDAALRAMAAAALAGLVPAGAVRLEGAEPTLGWPPGAPYDVILIEGAVAAIPEAIVGQLADGGRLVAVQDGRAVLGRRAGGTFGLLPQFDAAATGLAAFAPTPGFVF